MFRIPALLVLANLVTAAFAQDKAKDILADEVASTQVKLEGWDRYLGLGLNGTLVSNQNVIGKEEGQSTTLGLKGEGALDWRAGLSQWSNSLAYIAASSRTPLLGKYVKSEDTLQLQSLYKYLLSPSLGIGAFARLQAESSLFEGFDNRPQPVTYQINREDGSIDTRVGNRLKLTDGLRPFKVSESIGAFVNILDRQALSLDVKAGVGLRQVLARDQLVIADNADTPEIEVNRLADYRKAGYEIGSDLKGASDDKRISYKLTANILFPFYESPEVKGDDSTFAKRIMDLNGILSFHLLEWASVDYVLKAIRDPDLIDKTQLSQSFLLSTNYVFADRRKE